MPCYADNATYVVETKTRELSQIKVEETTSKIKNFLNSQYLCVNLSKTSMVESMVIGQAKVNEIERRAAQTQYSGRGWRGENYSTREKT